MLVSSVATAAVFAVLGMEATVDAAVVTPKQKMEFMRAMNGMAKQAKRSRKLSSKDQKEFKDAVYGTSKTSSNLRKKIIEKSIVTKAPGAEEGGERKLQNYNQNKQKYNADHDGSDDYFAGEGDFDNGFGFDVAQYSLSYHRCASVRQYSAEVAAMEDTTSVFSTEHFAVFRFCPEHTCMGFDDRAENEWECDEEKYGEEFCERMTYQFMYGESQEKQQAQAYAQIQAGNFDYFSKQEEAVLIRGARGDGCQVCDEAL